MTVGSGPAVDASGKVSIRPARDDDGQAWDAFVLATDGGTFFHRFGWRGLFRDIFHLIPRYLLAERAGRINGILPLVHQKSMIFGSTLVAAPFCVEGGPLAADLEARNALDAAAIQLQAELKVPTIEFRSRAASRPGWIAKCDLYATFAREILPDDESNLTAIPRKQRAVLRKALKSSLDSDVDDGVDALFRVYSESVRNLGTPVFPKRYFSALKETFGRDCDVVTIRDGGVAVSSVMNFYFKDRVLPYYGGGTWAARKSGANDLLYWEVMRRARQRGCRQFDFGRSRTGTGAFAYKKNWGFEPQWLQYEYHLRPGATLPDKNPNNAKYARLIALWKKLPLPIANLIGPHLIGGLG